MQATLLALSTAMPPALNTALLACYPPKGFITSSDGRGLGEILPYQRSQPTDTPA